MSLIYTEGRVRQRVKALARRAGLKQMPEVAFTWDEVNTILGCNYVTSRWTQKALARVIAGSDTHPAVIWVDMPVSEGTLVHEVAHLIPSRKGADLASHDSGKFKIKMAALARGKDPHKAKLTWYDVKIVTEQIYRVHELSAAGAKKRYMRGRQLVDERSVTAKKVNL